MGDYRKSHIAGGYGKDYDRIYADSGGVADAFYWEHFEKPLVAGLFAELSATGNGRYLDFAAGTGRIAALAAPHYHKVVGVDVSESMLNEAREKLPTAEFHLADVTTQSLALGQFDTISMFRFILNAQPDLRESALRWVRSAIAPDGFLIVNNHMNTWSVAGLATWLANRLTGRTLNYLSDRQAVELLRRCGFEVIRSYGFRFLPSWRGHLILPRKLLLKMERVLSGCHLLRRLAKDRIYVCLPI